jgi:hypothetical protein
VAKRKSLDEALNPEDGALSPQLEAFVKNSRAASPAKPAMQRPANNTPKIVPDEEMLILPQVPDFADAGLTTLNVRIEPSIVGAVLRASMVRKIQKVRPYAQREIVSEALREWLLSRGYLK